MTVEASPTAVIPIAAIPTAGIPAAGIPAAVIPAAGPVDAIPAPDQGGAARPPSLSPSRAADFKTCPLLFRFRTIDRLPERPNPDAARGTLLHAVLERLFDLPAAERTPLAADGLIAPEWARMREAWAELAEMFTDGLTEDEFVAGARSLLGGYFAVEDPQRLEPAEREALVEARLGDELLLRGIIDRLDVAPDGAVRVVDYKTGGAPREAFEARALFQLKFYALVVWRTRGVVPRVLRLLYLKDAEICDYTPDEDELVRFERTLLALWRAIERAKADRDFRPKPSRLCGWCSHQAFCPAFGGTPPPYPERVPDPVASTGSDDAVVVDEVVVGPSPSPGGS